MRRPRIVQLVVDDTLDGPVGVGIDIVGTAQHVGRGRLVPEHRVVSIDGAPVCTATGRTMAVDGALSMRSLRRGDVLVLPGLGMATPEAIGRGLQRADVKRAITLVARAARAGVRVAASCSAVFVLAGAGVLDGREATTTWWLGPSFAQRFPRVTLRTDRMVVESRGVLTAGSAFAHADLMLAVLARTTSPSLAHTVAKYLVLDERDSQARYMVLEHLRSTDPIVRALERYITANLTRQVTIAEMARATATSARTLARRVASALGTTPQQLAQRLRVARAVQLLETTSRSIDDIAEAVGYADPAAFRRVFRRETGETPRARRTRTIR